MLKQNGAELVLHGHNHEQTVHEIDTVSGPAFVVGVPSASEAVEGRIPAARYNEYCIARKGNGWRVEMIGRSVAAAPEHVWESERRVLRSSTAEPDRGEQPGSAGQEADDEGRDDDSRAVSPATLRLACGQAVAGGSTSAASSRSRRTISRAM